MLNGKIAHKSVDKLLHYAGRLGIEAKAKFAQTQKDVVERELALADKRRAAPAGAHLFSKVCVVSVHTPGRRTRKVAQDPLSSLAAFPAAQALSAPQTGKLVT